MINDTLDLVADQIDNNTISYIKDIPEKSAPYAVVNKVGGITRKCANLAKPIGNINPNGFTTVLNDDGSVTLRGSATAKQDTVINLTDTDRPADMTAGNTYSLIVLKDGVNATKWGCRVDYIDDIGGSVYGWNNQDISRPRKLARVYLQFTPEVGDTTHNGTYTVMLNSGDTALPYEPYFEGLRSAEVTEVESVGKCLFPASAVYGEFSTEEVKNGINCYKYITSSVKKTTPINFKENTQYTFSINHYAVKKVTEANTGDCVFAIWYTDGTNTLRMGAADEKWRTFTITSDEGKTISAIGVNVHEYRIDNYIDIDSFRVVEGTEIPKDCEPYSRNTLAIPDEVKALDGYGWGMDEEDYNYVDFENKQFVKKVVKLVLDGSEAWTKQNGNSTASYFRLKLGEQGYIVSEKVLCNKFDNYAVASANTGIGIRALNSSSSKMAMISLRPEDVSSMTVE